MEILEKFNLIETKELPWVKSTGEYYEHKKSGAKLIFLKNQDENKVFSASFRTLPEDQCGAPHIVEHCLLAGSDEFPIREPFMELIKSSLYTFLNAMTYPDKTVYPVASCNNADFKNLLTVYLDAVFAPLITSRKESFLQEGWSYSLADENAPLTINGVVYNEMKGAYSDPYDSLYNSIMLSLFPDNQLSNDSGGNPDFIPDLTYEKFLEFYKTHYHPSNCFLYLYGDVNQEEILPIIDKYLSRFDKTSCGVALSEQKPFSAPISSSYSYPVSEGELSDKHVLSINYALNDVDSLVSLISLKILNYILMGTPASPLKKALMETGIAQDYTGTLYTETESAVLSFTAKNAIDGMEKFRSAVNACLQGIAESGFDKDIVLAAYEKYLFSYREEDYGYHPKGLQYNLMMVGGWLYKNETFEALSFLEAVEKSKKLAEEGYLESLIKKFILENNHAAYVSLVPDCEMENKKQEELERKLAEYKNSLSEDEIKKLVEDTKSLIDFQNKTDNEEDMKKMPVLRVSDIKKESDFTSFEPLGKKGYYFSDGCNGIIYTNMVFSAESVSRELVPYMGILKYLLTRIDIEDMNYTDFSNELNLKHGSFHVTFTAFDEKDGFMPSFVINAKTLTENIDYIFSSMKKLTTTVFDDKNRIKALMSESKSKMEDMLLSNGNSYGLIRAYSGKFKKYGYCELVDGISYYEFLCALLNNFEAKFEEIRDNLYALRGLIFNRETVTLFAAFDLEQKAAMEKKYARFLNELNTSYFVKSEFPFEEKRVKEAFIVPSKVQYVCGCGFHGKEMDGTLSVLSNIIHNDYLYPEIRAKGGAYGCGADLSKTGEAGVFSYRDPNIKKSMEVYSNIKSFTEGINISQEDIEKRIIGAINRQDRPISINMKLSRATGRFYFGETKESLDKFRREILDTNLETLKTAQNRLEGVNFNDNICVIGGDSIINSECADFDSIKKLF